MNVWHDIDESRITPDDFLAYVEISKGERTKYELDKKSGFLILDRVLYTSTHYPANYGFLPKTFADDGDPLDVLILCNEPIQPMVLVHCYPIGVINMIDNDSMDEKIIAIAFNDPTYNSYKDITDLPSHIFEEMRHFFSVYKQLEGKNTAVDEVMDAKKARKIIQQSINNYKLAFGNKVKNADFSQ
ncbi:MAG: inorganic diphosphatase [Oscillospiraceae bacterium]|nr:inorganic diphosphatase [Oscillospiraceae bacterium]